MTDRPPHREWMDLRAYLKTRVAENDLMHVAKFVADTAEPSDPDHAAAIRAAWRIVSAPEDCTCPHVTAAEQHRGHCGVCGGAC